MRILYVTPYVPSRIRVRPFHLIRELSKRHEVYVLALGDADDTKIPGLEELREAARELTIVPHSAMRGACQSLAALPTGSPMCAAYCRSRPMQTEIQGILARVEFDVVHVEHLRAAHFAPRHAGLPVVFDSVDCLTSLFAQISRSKGGLIHRAVAAEEAWKLRKYEPRILRGFRHVLVTSESERDGLLALDRSLSIAVAPNGVDTEYFAPEGSDRKPGRLVFSGKMSYAPNVEAVLWFADNVLQALRREFDDLELVIVGSSPPREVQRLSDIPGVTVTGFVEDMRPYLDGSAIAIAPIRTAVGMQNKIAEAMAMGLPVVTTSMAGRTFGKDCPGLLEADSGEGMVRIISQMIRDPAEAADTGRRGRDEVEKRFSWRSSAELVESIYEEVVRNPDRTNVGTNWEKHIGQ